ncbi:hypothetical protein PVK06_007510 [Gossypium arboreum]|uniref:RNase H type-1 domain-containing protein n=1 Tax=Gossypium arboreum TaxID=29729 RepID=A0ABR0QIG6_GOSAR|nr:hypothetical protein PVK06_007510 [Gossypium arboreum]
MQELWERAKTLSHDFRIHNLANKPVIPTTPACKKWVKPPDGYVTINFHTSVFNGNVGFGVIARDSDGFVIGRSGGFKEKIVPAEWAELEAFEESLKVANSFNISKAVFESDCASLVSRINNRGKDITILGSRVNNKCYWNFNMDYPLDIHDLVTNDAIN